MDAKPDIATVAATVVVGAAAEALWDQVGVITVGAIGGAFWALMQSESSKGWATALRFMSPRAVRAFCLAWLPAFFLQEWLVEHKYEIPVTVTMLALSFFLASPRELLAEAAPIIRLVMKLRFKE